MNERAALASIEYQPGQVTPVLEFLKRTRSELRTLRMVRVWRDRLRVFDVNGDWFEVARLGYADPHIIEVLDALGAAFRRETISEPTDIDYKEFKTGRRHPWAADRVM